MTAPPAPLGAWRRLHPLTPVLRGGRVVLALAAALYSQALSGLRSPAALVALLPLFLAGAVLSWRRTRFRVDGLELQVESGLLLHRSRRVPLARVQAIDVVRPLVGRMLGLAELRLEVVGGGSAEAPLAYLREDEADRLRTELLALVRGEQPGTGEHRSVERPLVVVPTRALVGSLLLDPVTALPLLLLVAVAIGAALVPLRVLAGVVAAVAGVFFAAAEVLRRRLLAEWAFTISEGADGLVLRHGLVETRSQTVPRGRVQGVRVVAPLLWRTPGWVRAEVSVAGYGGRGESLSSSTLLPVAPAGLARELAGRVLEADLPGEHAPPPRRARWLAPLAWPGLGAALDDALVSGGSGWLRRSTAAVPLTKVQGVSWRQGPLQRRLGLATVTVHSAGRDLGCRAVHRDEREAQALLHDIVRRSRVCRTRAGAR